VRHDRLGAGHHRRGLGRFLGAVVAGDPPLLEPAVRERMLTPALPLPKDPGYGYNLGVEVDTEAGWRRVGHQGDCPGYCSYAYGCPETGVGVVALGNGPWRPPASSGVWAVVDHGLALLRAAALGRDLPADPDPPGEPPPEPEPATRESRPLARGGQRRESQPAAGRGQVQPHRCARDGRDHPGRGHPHAEPAGPGP
jgi:Beta-lactamase